MWVAASASPGDHADGHSGDASWHLLAPYDQGSVDNGQDLRGQLEVNGCSMGRDFNGSSEDLAVEVRRWQASDVAPDTCAIARQWEVHRYMCVVDGLGPTVWVCRGWQIEARPPEALRLDPHCSTQPALTAPAWAVDLHVTDREIDIERRSGTIPPNIELGPRRLDRAFAQSD